MRVINFTSPRLLLPVLAATVLAGLTPQSHGSEVVDGFTEPYRDIDVAASEMGPLVAVEVREGDRVTAGQVLARLDETVLLRTLDIARAGMESNGRLEAARAELRMYQESLDQLEELLSRSHASQREIDRARAQRDMAEARLKATQEEMGLRSLEFERTRAQLQQRRVMAPIDGIVTRVYKDESEFVSPTDPTVVKIVQLDPLLIVFSVPVAEARNLATNKTVQVEQDGRTIEGTVEFVSSVADAQSGTVRVRVRIANPGESIPGGVTCRLLLPVGPEGLVKAPASR